MHAEREQLELALAEIVPQRLEDGRLQLEVFGDRFAHGSAILTSTSLRRNPANSRACNFERENKFVVFPHPVLAKSRGLF